MLFDQAFYEKIAMSGMVTLSRVTPNGFLVLFGFFEQMKDLFNISVQNDCQEQVFEEVGISKDTVEALSARHNIDFPDDFWKTYSMLCTAEANAKITKLAK